MQHHIRWGVNIDGSEQFQRLALYAVVSLGIAIWAALLLQWRGDEFNGATALHASTSWKLTSIVIGEAGNKACINGCWVGVGDKHPGNVFPFEVVSIDRHQVVLNHRNGEFALRIHDRPVQWDMFEVTR
ncbi:MAG: hypothetical protein O2955_18535 [Planctomycetota bacterium]|nr:hypothetical protein [Planctomycetota bacterium]MDA1214511.1 hypothetical protein [Planctomycetota bacterium]